MKNQKLFVALLTVTSLFAGITGLTACNKNAIKSPPMGFLSKPNLMKKQSDDTWQYVAPKTDWSKYTSVYVAPVSIGPAVMNGKNVEQTAELPQLVMKFKADLEKEMTKKYTRAESAGPNTLVVRVQLVKAEPNAPALNIAPQTQMGGMGFGFGEIAIEIADGATGTPLFEYANVQNTSRFSTEKMSVWGSLEKSFTEWIAVVVKACDAS